MGHILLLLHMPVISEVMVDMNVLCCSVSEAYFLPVETLGFALGGSQGLRISLVLSRLILSLPGPMCWLSHGACVLLHLPSPAVMGARPVGADQ